MWLQDRRRRRATPALPLAPAINDLSVQSVGNTSVTVYWESVQSESVEFVAMRRESPAGAWAEAGSGLASDGGYTFEGLTSEVAYDFKLQTFGAAGAMEFDPASRVDSNLVTETPGADIPDAPTNVQVDGSYVVDAVAFVTFSWTPPASPVESYSVGIVLAGSPMAGPFEGYGDGYGDPLSGEFTLQTDTTYDVAVKALYNGQESVWSVAHQFTTPGA